MHSKDKPLCVAPTAMSRQQAPISLPCSWPCPATCFCCGMSAGLQSKVASYRHGLTVDLSTLAVWFGCLGGPWRCSGRACQSVAQCIWEAPVRSQELVLSTTTLSWWRQLVLFRATRVRREHGGLVLTRGSRSRSKVARWICRFYSTKTIRILWCARAEIPFPRGGDTFASPKSTLNRVKARKIRQKWVSWWRLGRCLISSLALLVTLE
mmetsp:Transcript_92910/g.135756  ORF Transcript_92910/g.135756 Transcript_92910/m.135756 type:complete len:209 (-) Transcript_92910:2005-2631(-)